jgi:lipopolysaccharide/colanic/teichoic acid biosynthesis glycosyltransferase
MKLVSLLKYFVRFLFLQTLITIVTIWYFDYYVFFNADHKFDIYLNLLEDRERFYTFIPLSWVTIDGLIFALVTLFMIILYSTKFYTYVNELDFSYENRFLDDYLMLYLMWNSFIFSSLYVFRIEGLSRGNLILFSFIVPFILLVFRNSEIMSLFLGRSISKENYISFNLDEFSNFKNLRITAYRNEKLSINCEEDKITSVVQNEVNQLNKIVNLNLIVLRLEDSKKLRKELENYLINLNKKVLIISDQKLSFSTNFIYRLVKVESKFLYYFNNDIQYGAKYIFKRLVDIIISLIVLIFTSPLLLIVSILILAKGGVPFVIKQSRIGLHGRKFNMYKFKTMYNNSHNKRADLNELNPKKGPLFKIDEDPRVINGLSFLRKYSLDELPQLFNVIKGEMSLVGPRPLFEEDSEYFDKKYMRRLNVLPGMTGLLQINDRNTDDFDIWYKYDIEYIENWNLYLDLKILLKTFKAIRNNKTAGK